MLWFGIASVVNRELIQGKNRCFIFAPYILYFHKILSSVEHVRKRAKLFKALLAKS